MDCTVYSARQRLADGIKLRCKVYSETAWVVLSGKFDACGVTAGSG